MSKIIITTERLFLRTWETGDAPFLAAINADPIVMEHFPATQDLASTMRQVDYLRQHYEKHGYTSYAVEIKETGECIGFVGLNRPSFEILNFVPKAQPIVEIGWRLSRHHWNKGYATEAAKAVLHYAFTELKLNEIISFAVAENKKSRHVMEKIGLKHSAADNFDHPQINDGSPIKHHVLYRLTRNEYLKK